MITQGYKFKFLSGQALQEAEKTLLLAMAAAEGLYGEARVRMDATYVVDKDLNTVAVDSSTDVGQDIASIFAAYVIKELGQAEFIVRRLSREDQP